MGSLASAISFSIIGLLLAVAALWVTVVTANWDVAGALRNNENPKRARQFRTFALIVAVGTTLFVTWLLPQLLELGL